jgi:hypothetical protein
MYWSVLLWKMWWKEIHAKSTFRAPLIHDISSIKSAHLLHFQIKFFRLPLDNFFYTFDKVLAN